MQTWPYSHHLLLLKSDDVRPSAMSGMFICRHKCLSAKLPIRPRQPDYLSFQLLWNLASIQTCGQFYSRFRLIISFTLNSFQCVSSKQSFGVFFLVFVFVITLKTNCFQFSYKLFIQFAMPLVLLFVAGLQPNS